MADLMRVPEVAAGAADVIISEWLIAPGAAVRRGEPLVVVETDKAIVEVEAEVDGVLLRPLAEPGQRADVGSPLALLGTAAEIESDLNALLGELGVGAEPSAAVTQAVEAEESFSASASELPEVPPARDEPGRTDAPAPTVDHGGSSRRPVSPIARRLLREAGMTAEGIQGTGPGDRVTRRDVQAALASRSTAQDVGSRPTAEVSSSEETGWSDIPHSRLRRAVAQRLGESKRQIPHFYVRRSVRIDDLLELRARLNAAGGVKISVNDMVLRAVALAHQQVPEANVIWTDDALRRYERVDLAVAIASPNGLVTPVLRGVESLSLGQISKGVKGFVEQAGISRLQQRDLEGGSISVTNLGMYGVDEFAAIINPPHSMIVAVGAGRPQPVADEVDGELHVGAATVMNIVLSVDHRAIDGALAAQWLDALVAILESPFRLVL